MALRNIVMLCLRTRTCRGLIYGENSTSHPSELPHSRPKVFPKATSQVREEHTPLLRKQPASDFHPICIHMVEMGKTL